MGQHIGANTEHERDSWLEAIQMAGYSRMRAQLLSLQQKLEAKRGHKPDLDVQMWRISRGHTIGTYGFHLRGMNYLTESDCKFIPTYYNLIRKML